jgi:hypothetical protein
VPACRPERLDCASDDDPPDVSDGAIVLNVSPHEDRPWDGFDWGYPGWWSVFPKWHAWWDDADGLVALSGGSDWNPRAVNLLVLDPDTVNAGDPATVCIHGGFPRDDWEVGTDVQIDVQVRLNEGGAWENWVTSARVEERDPFHATIWRTLSLELAVPETAALGLYDVKVTCADATGEGVDGVRHGGRAERTEDGVRDPERGRRARPDGRDPDI